jgi:hypothetical protein
LIKENVKEQRRKDAPLQNATLNFDNKASRGVGGVTDGAGVPRQHPRNDPDGDF